MRLDFDLRARVHALETEAQKSILNGIWSFAPCIRSTMVSVIYHLTLVPQQYQTVLSVPFRSCDHLPKGCPRLLGRAGELTPRYHGRYRVPGKEDRLSYCP